MVEVVVMEEEEEEGGGGGAFVFNSIELNSVETQNTWSQARACHLQEAEVLC